MNKFLYGLFAAIGGVIAEAIRRWFRKKGQTNLQKRVDKSAPKTVKQDLTVRNEQIQITVKESLGSDALAHCQEIAVSKEEADDWKAFLSATGGETIKAALLSSSFNGLLRCDVPLKELCRINGNPEMMRGFVISDGKISRQASFTEAGIGNAAPLMIYQCLAAVTSQYYQQIITERLDTINSKLDGLLSIDNADKKAKLSVAYSHFVELSKKSKYDNSDKMEVVLFSKEVEELRESYRNRLSEIKNLNLNDFKYSDKKEAEYKIKKLEESFYFNKLEMAMQAEALCFIASAISMKIAYSLGNKEDVQIYAKRMNLDYWNTYADQFHKIKHDVLTYLELQADSSWMQGESIMEMKNTQSKRFSEVKNRMLDIQNKLNYNTVQYVKFQSDGSVKKYVPIAKS